MLKLILATYVDVDELAEFITRYEMHLGGKVFTSKSRIFGEEVQISTHKEHMFGTVAKRVKHIRNALVHSSDRHKLLESYVPTQANQETVRKEMPLVRFLAERVIVGTASPIIKQ